MLPKYNFFSYTYMYTCMCVCVCVFTQPLCTSWMRQKFIFTRSLTGLKPVLSYLSIAERRIVRFPPFSMLLPLCEMQTALRRFELTLLCLFPTTITIMPRVPLSLSLSIYIYIYICVCVCVLLSNLICFIAIFS